MDIKQINAADTYTLRQSVLRPDHSLENVHFDGDEDDQTFHLGAFEKNKLVSISSFYFERHPDFDVENQYRLRGMATAPEFRGKGISSSLLETAFPIIKQNLCQLVWCNARMTALDFYKKVGFIEYGSVFDIKTIGPHIVVSKKI